VTPSNVLRTVWRRRLVALGLLAAVMAGGAIFLFTQKKVYESEVMVALLPRPDPASSLPFYPDMVKSLLPTYSQVVKSGVILQRVATSLGTGDSVEGLKRSVFVRTVPGTAVVSVVAHTSSARNSAYIAQLTAEEFVAEVRAGGVLEGSMLNAAQPAKAPIAPNRPLAAGAIAVVGLAVAGIGALTFDRHLGRIETVQQLRDEGSAPVLGAISYDRRLRREPPRLVVSDPSFQLITEDLRYVHANLLLALREHPRALIAVTALRRGDGTSLLTANLGVIVAEYGRDALVIDADLAKPAQAEIFGIVRSQSLTATEQSGVRPEDLPQATHHPRLGVISAGAPQAGSASEVGAYLRQLPRFGELADVALIDTPPLEGTADARLLAASVGAVVLVVKAGSTTTRRLREVMENLQRAGVLVLGLVLTQDSGRKDRSRRKASPRYLAPSVHAEGEQQAVSADARQDLAPTSLG
jgi:polysaccharide biosynthesis transport protein